MVDKTEVLVGCPLEGVLVEDDVFYLVTLEGWSLDEAVVEVVVVGAEGVTIAEDGVVAHAGDDAVIDIESV